MKKGVKKMLASQTKRTLYIVAGFLTVLGLLAATYLYYQNISIPSNQGGVVVNSAAAKFLKMTPEQRREMFEQVSRDKFRFDSVEQASSALAFKLKEPKYPALQSKRVAILVNKDEVKENREAHIYYGDPGNPIAVWAGRLPPKENPDEFYDKDLEQFRSDKEKGYLKSDAILRIVYINGHKGIGIEPGYNLIGGEKVPRPGVVDFMVDGIRYVIAGTTGENATTLDELIKIAESIE